MTVPERQEGNGAYVSPSISGPAEFHLAKPPRLATANDIRELVQYLKRRPNGVNIHDVPQPIKKRIFFPAKIASYEFWGLISVVRDRATLTREGWEFARSLDPEASAYRALLHGTSFYTGALEWIHRQQIDIVTQYELANFWGKEFAWVFLNTDGRDIASAVITFFHLCQAAEVGAMTIGKRGQPARLRVWRDGLLQALDRDPELVKV